MPENSTTDEFIPDYVTHEALLSPQEWQKGEHVHNWRNYIGPRIRARWESLPDDLKVALAGDADDRANLEDWE